MSLIVGACKWLRDNQQNHDLLFKRYQDRNSKGEEKKEEEDNGLPSWINNFQDAQKRTYIKNQKEAKDKLISAFNKKPTYRSTNTAKANNDPLENDLIDYESEEEECSIATKKTKYFPDGEDPSAPENDDFKVKRLYIKESLFIKIIYATRTHSQLKQFVKEIQKTPFSKF